MYWNIALRALREEHSRSRQPYHASGWRDPLQVSPCVILCFVHSRSFMVSGPGGWPCPVFHPILGIEYFIDDIEATNIGDT
jgi:hypothetical protein